MTADTLRRYALDADDGDVRAGVTAIAEAPQRDDIVIVLLEWMRANSSVAVRRGSLRILQHLSPSSLKTFAFTERVWDAMQNETDEGWLIQAGTWILNQKDCPKDARPFLTAVSRPPAVRLVFQRMQATASRARRLRASIAQYLQTRDTSRISEIGQLIEEGYPGIQPWLTDALHESLQCNTDLTIHLILALASKSLQVRRSLVRSLAVPHILRRIASNDAIAFTIWTWSEGSDSDVTDWAKLILSGLESDPRARASIRALQIARSFRTSHSPVMFIGKSAWDRSWNVPSELFGTSIVPWKERAFDAHTRKGLGIPNPALR